jgi:Nucleotidyl transferase AbiEii toxin, Type IV TA system
LYLSDEPSIQGCLDAQAHFGLPSLALVQKDWRVIRAMQAVASVETGPFKLIFAGGTCLARGHRLVQRMSEDVDFKLVHTDPSPVSGSSLRRQLGDLRSRVMASLQTAGFSAGPDDIRSRDGNRYLLYNLRYAQSGDTVAGYGGGVLK